MIEYHYPDLSGIRIAGNAYFAATKVTSVVTTYVNMSRNKMLTYELKY